MSRGPRLQEAPRPPRRLWPWLVGSYLLALLLSHLVRNSRPPQPLDHGVRAVAVHTVSGSEQVPGTVRLAYRTWGDMAGDAPVLVLVHGSPGDSRVMQGMGSLLGDDYRVIAPDLPGFGNSTEDIPDYSVLAHSRYLEQLLDSLRIDRAHLVGFSMGGGVILELADAFPQRVASLTMLSAIGVQEHELLGDYHLNHAVHGLQLGALWVLYQAVPHFGLLDANWLNVAYARNFYDTDQRPLRGALERWNGPMLILHGDQDPLVPAGAAYEHERIVPQAQLVMYRGDHFMTFLRPGDLVGPLADFVERVETGTATTRATADQSRLARAAQPFDPATVPPKEGFSLFVVVVLIAAATLVSEDLATISAGLLVARGSLTFLSATGAALAGIFLGDMLLFLAGRWIGRPLLGRAPLRWMIRPAEVERTRNWFARRGPALVLASRFLPGTRLPTYFTAGMLHMPLLVFTGWFLLATLIWTPILVAASVVFGNQLGQLLSPDAPAVWPWVVGVIGFMLLVRLLIQCASYRGRRLLLSRWRRLREWEFWPPLVLYPPVALYVLWLGLRYRCLTLFTAANPALPDGGFVGESKAEMLEQLAKGTRGSDQSEIRVADICLIPAALGPEQRVARANEFVQRLGGGYPVVAKPDGYRRGPRSAGGPGHRGPLRPAAAGIHTRSGSRGLLLPAAQRIFRSHLRHHREETPVGGGRRPPQSGETDSGR